MKEKSREKRRKRRHSYEEDDEEEGISSWKLGMVVGVIVVCFAMLYPVVFHPLIMGFFGGRDQAKANPSRPPVHPGMGGRHAPPSGAGPGGRMHDHPAMRMAAAQAESQSTTGGGKGMFTWMLPLYTVGVVVFLLYTLFKSKSKKGKRKGRYGSDSDDSSAEEDDRFSGKLGKKKLRGLQQRLRQTEDAMAKILSQLEAVQAEGVDLSGIDLDGALATTSEKKPKPEAPIPINAQSEQYIGDLEKALKEFKVLSAAYEKEKYKKMEEELEDLSVEETSEGELNSSESEDSEAEELRKQKERASRRREKEKKKTKESSEEEVITSSKKKEDENPVEPEEPEEEGFDVDQQLKESVITSKFEEKKVKKRSRRT